MPFLLSADQVSLPPLKEAETKRKNYNEPEGLSGVLMGAAASEEITSLLKAWSRGQASALDGLIPLVYAELKRLARRHMRSSDHGTLQTTALVHEAYLRLVDVHTVNLQDRAHFFALSARIIRGILVDAARARQSKKRGGLIREPAGSSGLGWDLIPGKESGRVEEILTLHEALDRLAEQDPRQVQVVEMRFFGGLTVEETAEVLKVSPQTVLRDWKLAKAWLRRETRRGAD